MDNKGLLTIAVGKKFLSQAKYLAYSAMLHAPHILRAVITDRPDALKNYYDILIPYNSDYGSPFTVKTRLPLYTPFEKTLYIDADSLVINRIDVYWEALDERAFVYNGSMLDQGNWYLDIAALSKRINVPWIPEFNSGMFLFNKSEKAKSIFEMAYTYMNTYKDTEIAFFRGKMLPDEPFLSMALAKCAEEPFYDYGRFSRTLIDADNIHLDVIKGIAFYRKDERTVFPSIVHFCGTFGRILYFREKIKLLFYFSPPLQIFLISCFTFIRKIYKKIKNRH